jgi:hypothetical protein
MGAARRVWKSVAEAGGDQGADVVGGDGAAGGADEVPVDPVVGVDEHQEAAAALQDQVVDRVLLAAAVGVVGAGVLGGPAGLQELEAGVVGEGGVGRSWPRMTTRKSGSDWA